MAVSKQVLLRTCIVMAGSHQVRKKLTGCNSWVAIVVLEDPYFVPLLITDEIPTMMLIVVQIQRLAHVMGKHQIGWLTVSFQVNGAGVTKGEREVSKGAEERSPHTANTVSVSVKSQ